MIKKITAALTALVLIFGPGALKTANVLPDTAVSASAEALKTDEVMSELEAKVTFTNDSGARYVAFGEMTKDVTHETQGSYDRKYTFKIKGEDLLGAMDGDLTGMIDHYQFSAAALTDEYVSISINSAFVSGVINYRSGESRGYYTFDTGEEIMYLPSGFKMEYDKEKLIFTGDFRVAEKMYKFDPEEIENIVIDYWINTSDITLNRHTEDKTPSDAVHIGDINEDGVIDIEDVTMLINHINGVKNLDVKEKSIADVDRNGVADIEDAVVIVNHINGVRSL